ncbi:MAG TPA: glycosyltransferase family 4 protein, partial [Cytophagales bacterium]|nr:glycosyltransferase family 4 protein [Cytophagales bacterium]
IVSYLTEELVKMGHEVTLFASGDSITKARLIPCCTESLRLNKNCEDQLTHHFIMLEKVIREMNNFDVIHYHIDYFHFLSSRIYNRVPHLTTLHGRLDIPDLVPLYREYYEMPVNSISYAQRNPLSWINWTGNVYHGLPMDLFTPGGGAGDYLAFLGRVSPEKGVDKAIEIATQAEMPLKIAAKIDHADKDYFEEKIKHLLDHPLIEFIGEINEKDKQTFLGEAKALLFPIDWQEPFGLVMIESMACGTPVIAFNVGSVPEIMEDGKTGFIVSSTSEAVKALDTLSSIDRLDCRKIFEERFTADRMAKEYVALYKSLTNSGVRGRSFELTVA